MAAPAEAEGARPVLDLPRLKAPLGTFDDSVFQAFSDAKGAPGSPPSQYDMLGYLCVPHVGVYGDDYTPCGPLGVVGLPAYAGLLRHQLPAKLVSELAGVGILPAGAGEGKEAEVELGDHLPKLDLFLMLHSAPTAQPCQKLICDNWDEANLMFHCWCYPDAKFDPDLEVNNIVPMGVFEASGIKPVHTELSDSGVAFDKLDPRSVVLHMCRFSPENAQFQLAHTNDICTFYSAAVYDGRAVVTLHVLPAVEKGEKAVREALADPGSTTVEGLVKALEAKAPDAGALWRKAVGPYGKAMAK